MTATSADKTVLFEKAILQKMALISGIIASLLYIAMNIFVPFQFPGYCSFSQTVSELSAVGAPSRPTWVFLGTIYTLLMTAFGWGIWSIAVRNHGLRVTGCLVMAYGITGIGWAFAPMHLRETLAAGGNTITDTLHIVLAIITVLLMLPAMGFSAAALGKAFRYYSVISMFTLSAFGLLTSLDAPNIDKNLPTPWTGVWERINIGVFLLWVIVLALILLRNKFRRTVPVHD